MRLPVFYMTAWGSFLLASCLSFEVHIVPLSEQRSPYSWEVLQCWLIRAITAGPGRSTAFGPIEDNCFTSRWGELLTTGGRSPSPPGSFSERRVDGEDALQERHFGKNRVMQGAVKKATFHWVAWWKEFDMVNLFSLEKWYLIFKGKSLGWNGECLSTPNIVSSFYLVLLMKNITAFPWALGGM